MTIRQRIIIGVLLQAAMICIIGVFAYFSLNNISSKLRSIEIIDDVNIALLEIRKAEKNYFLYKDPNALRELIKLGDEKEKTVISSEAYMVQTLHQSGQKNYERLLTMLRDYLSLAKESAGGGLAPKEFEGRLRSLGKELTSISEQLIREERQNISRLISYNIVMLIASLGVIFVIQLILWHFFFSLIIQELAIMDRMIKKVSAGRLQEVAVANISPQNEIEIALEAISDMAAQLAKREEEMMQTGKLASLGVLISGVAHELGNPLNNISLMAQTYLSVYEMLGDEEKKTYMGDIYNQTERIRKIVENLLDFSRQKKQELKKYDIADIIRMSLNLVGNHLKLAGVTQHLSLAPDLPPVYVDVSQIEQVLINLFINAIQAMSKGGDLFINASSDPQSENIILEIKDTGAGIKGEVLPYIFDPFFSTKGTKGIGLGLSVSYGIIRQHQGEIAVESEEGKGTRFIIKLPAMKT